MKVSIDEAGMMLIESETPLESYALQRWSKDYMETNTNRHIMIKTGLETLLANGVYKMTDTEGCNYTIEYKDGYLTSINPDK